MPTEPFVTRRHHDADAAYSWRRPLRVRDLVPAIGIGIAAGLAAFYVATLLIQRTPLVVDRSDDVARRQARRSPARRPRARARLVETRGI